MRAYGIALAIVFALVPAMVHASSICDSAPFSFACSQLGGNGGSGGAGGSGGDASAGSSSSANPIATSYGSPSNSTSTSYGAPQISTLASFSTNVNRQAQEQTQGQSQSIEFNPTISNTFTPTNTFAPSILICPQDSIQTAAPQQPNRIIVASAPSTYPVLPLWARNIVGPEVPSLSCS